MKLSVTRADPAGNITLLVRGPVPKQARAAAALELMSRYGGEQTGFIVSVSDADIGLAMMGGEFCGNALRCAGYYYASRHGGAEVSVRISGCSRLLSVKCDIRAGTAEAEMPLPSAFGDIGGIPVAVFDGIAHALCREHAPDEDYARRLTAQIADKYHVSAAGVMFLRNGFMNPAVYVRDTGTLYFESSCASGSAAVAALLSARRPDGTYTYELAQPGGTITATARVLGGTLTSLSIGGVVGLGETFDAEISGDI